MEILMKEIVFGLGRQVLGSIVSNLNIIFLFGHYGLVGCDAKSMTATKESGTSMGALTQDPNSKELQTATHVLR